MSSVRHAHPYCTACTALGRAPCMNDASIGAEHLPRPTLVCTAHLHLHQRAAQANRWGQPRPQFECRHAVPRHMGSAGSCTDAQTCNRDRRCWLDLIKERQHAWGCIARRHMCVLTSDCAGARAHTAPSALRYRLPANSSTRRQGGGYHPLHTCYVQFTAGFVAAQRVHTARSVYRRGLERTEMTAGEAHISGCRENAVLSLPYDPSPKSCS